MINPLHPIFPPLYPLPSWRNDSGSSIPLPMEPPSAVSPWIPSCGADRTFAMSKSEKLVDETGELLDEHWLGNLPPLNPRSLESIQQWLDTPLVGASPTHPQMTVRKLLGFIHQPFGKEQWKTKMSTVFLSGQGLFRLLLLSDYFPRPIGQGPKDPCIIDTAQLKSVALNQKGMKLEVRLYIAQTQPWLTVLHPLQQAIANHFPSHSYAMARLFNNKWSECGFSFRFYEGLGEPITIEVTGEYMGPPRKTQVPLEVPLHELLQPHQQQTGITPASACSAPWQPFFHLIHGIPLATISRQTPDRHCLSMLDSYTKQFRCVTPEMEEEIIAAFLSPFQDPTKRINAIIQALSLHLMEQGEVKASEAHALAFQVCYSLELDDQAAAAIWRTVNARLGQGRHVQNCLSYIAEEVARGSIPFSWVRSLVEVMGYIRLSAPSGSKGKGEPFSSRLTEMKNTLGMQLTLGDPVGSAYLLIDLDPAPAISWLIQAIKESPWSLSQELLNFYEILLPKLSITPQQAPGDLARLTGSYHTLLGHERMIAELIHSSTPFLNHIGLHLACVAKIQGGPCNPENLGFLPRALTLPLSTEANQQLIQNLGLYLPLGTHPLRDFARKLPSVRGTSEEALAVALVETLSADPTAENLLCAKQVWSQRAKSQSSLSPAWADLGGKVFRACETKRAINQMILMMDSFQKEGYFDFATRFQYFLQSCEACKSLGCSHESRTHVVNLGHIAIDLLMPENDFNEVIASNTMHWLLDQLLIEGHDDLADTLLRLVCRSDLIPDLDQLRDLFFKTCTQGLSKTNEPPVFSANLWKLGMTKGILGSDRENDKIMLTMAQKLFSTSHEYHIVLGLEILASINRKNMNPHELAIIDTLWSNYCQQPGTPVVKSTVDDLIARRISGLKARWEEIKHLANETANPSKRTLFLFQLQKLMEDLCLPAPQKEETSMCLRLALEILDDETLRTPLRQNHQRLAEVILTYLRQVLAFGDRDLIKESACTVGSLLTNSLIPSTGKLNKETHQALAGDFTSALRAFEGSIPQGLSEGLKHCLETWMTALENDAAYGAALDLMQIQPVPTRPMLNRVYRLALGLLGLPPSKENYLKAKDALKLAKRLTGPHRNPDPKLEANLLCALALYCFQAGDHEQGVSWAQQCNLKIPNIPLPSPFSDDVAACAGYCQKTYDNPSLALALLDQSCRHQDSLPASFAEVLCNLLSAPLSPELFLSCAELLVNNAHPLKKTLPASQWTSLAEETVERLSRLNDVKSLPLTLKLLETTEITLPAMWKVILSQAAETKDRSLQESAWTLWKNIENTECLGFSPQERLNCWLSALEVLKKAKHPDILTVALRAEEFAQCAQAAMQAPDNIEGAILATSLTYLQQTPEANPSEVLREILCGLYSKSPERCQEEQRLTLLQLGSGSSSPEILNLCCDLLQSMNTPEQKKKAAAALPVLLSSISPINLPPLHSKGLALAQALHGIPDVETTIECANSIVTLNHLEAFQEAGGWMLSALNNSPQPKRKRKEGASTTFRERFAEVCERLIAYATQSEHFKLTALCLDHREAKRHLSLSQQAHLRGLWVMHQLGAANALHWDKLQCMMAIEACFTHITDFSDDLKIFGSSLLQSTLLGLTLLSQEGEVKYFESLMKRVLGRLTKEARKARPERKKQYLSLYSSICSKFCNYWSTAPSGDQGQRITHLLNLDFNLMIQWLPKLPEVAGSIGLGAVERMADLIQEAGVNGKQRDELRAKAYAISSQIIKGKLIAPESIEKLITLYTHATTFDDAPSFESHLQTINDMLSAACKQGAIDNKSDFVYKTCLYISLDLPKGHSLTKDRTHQLVVEVLEELNARSTPVGLVRAREILRAQRHVLSYEEWVRLNPNLRVKL